MEGRSTSNPITDKQRDTRILARGASILVIGRLFGRGLNVLVQVVIARLLGPTAFGLYAVGWSLLRVVGVIAPLGLDLGVIRFGSKYWHRDTAALQGVLVQSLTFSLGSGFLVGLLLFFSASWLAEDFFKKPELFLVFRLFALVFPFVAALRVLASATLISQRVQFSVYAEELFRPATNLLLVVLLSLIGLRLVGAVTASVSSFLFAFFLGLWFLKLAFPEVGTVKTKYLHSVRQLLSFSAPVSLGTMFTVLLLVSNRFVVAYYRPASDVGIYQAASQVVVIFPVILEGFASILTPMIVELYQEGHKDRLRELFRVSTKWGLYCSVPFFLVCCFAPEELLSVVYGDDYAEGGWALLVLGVGQLVRAGTGAVGPLLMMTGYQKRWLWLTSFSLVMNVGLSLALIPRWGVIGAAVATSCSMAILFLGGLSQVKHLLDLWPYDRRYWKGVIALSMTVWVLSLARMLDIPSTLFSLLVSVALSCTIFPVSLLVARLDREDKDLLNGIMGRVSASLSATSKSGRGEPKHGR